MCSLIPFLRYPICPNWQSNIDMVNKNKKCDTDFWSDFSNLLFLYPVISLKIQCACSHAECSFVITARNTRSKDLRRVGDSQW